uniref:NADH-ubiquinone oxidoreductase chain 6 n=1 Tax=Sunius melanocephalus TaxID=1588492 RepID=A0A0S2M921_9COLE|nr:NADH deshydrogenase subunit 6 [Sunius melanocephalus]
MLLLLLLSLNFSLIFLMMNHPLSMGMVLLSQVIITSLISGILSMNFWFSYILFLIMIGGMLVLFIYMTSVASNEKFKFNMNLLISTIMIMIIIMLIYNMNLFLNNLLNFSLNLLNYENYIYLNKFINWPSNFIMFMMIIYLFITLIAVVKITNIKSGPLRQNS